MIDLESIAGSHASSSLSQRDLDVFASMLRGDCLRAGSDGYEEARRVWNGMIDRHPALIVRCAGVADVIDAVNFARTRRLLVAVRGGGHNVAGHAVCDGGIVVDLSLMKGIRVDPQTRTAHVQGGATWGDLDRETQAFGLATPGGVVSTTGVAGLTLGGGFGWLRGKHGLSCDNLLSVDIVTADGRFQTASQDENSELFWAIRGGGGNFGIVTSFEFRLHPVGPTVMFAAAMYPEARAAHVLRAWRDFMATAPDELTSMAQHWSIPPAPDIPVALHGKPVIIAAGLYAGPVDEGEQVTHPLREFDTPLVDLSGALPFTVVQSAFDPFFPQGEHLHYWKSIYLHGLGDEVIDAIVARADHRTSPQTMVNYWHMGAAVRRIEADETAFGDRSAPYLLEISSSWTDPRESGQHIEWTRDFWAAMKPFSPGGLYLNFPGFGEEGDDLVRAAYGANYQRLAELKKQYDPTNLFRLNQNIKPATD